MEESILRGPSVELNETQHHIIYNFGFSNLSLETNQTIFKDKYVFLKFIEKWICKNYPINFNGHFEDHYDNSVIYNIYVFTQDGCVIDERDKKNIICIVSNIDFPTINIRFIKGIDIFKMFKNGNITLNTSPM